MILREDITGVVLAGGRSRRFGESKARFQLPGHSKNLLLEAVDLLQRVVPEVVVMTNADDGFPEFSLNTHVDRFPDCGPLGGMETALEMIRARYALVLTCDMPFMDESLLRQLLDFGEEGRSCILFSRAGQWEPFPGLYSRDLQSLIHERIQQKQLAVKDFLLSAGIQTLDIPSEDPRFRNLNHRPWS